jgi:hypothetical protein
VDRRQRFAQTAVLVGQPQAARVLKPQALRYSVWVKAGHVGGVHCGLRNPLILDDPIDAGEDGNFAEHLFEAFEQWAQASFRHVWNEVVEHGALAK